MGSLSKRKDVVVVRLPSGVFDYLRSFFRSIHPFTYGFITGFYVAVAFVMFLLWVVAP